MSTLSHCRRAWCGFDCSCAPEAKPRCVYWSDRRTLPQQLREHDINLICANSRSEAVAWMATAASLLRRAAERIEELERAK